MRTFLNTIVMTTAMTLIAPLAVDNAANASAAADNSKIKLFGDVRLRMEADNQTKQDDSNRKRIRNRYRARLGVNYQTNKDWSAKIRLATGTALNSPHVSFRTADRV